MFLVLQLAVHCSFIPQNKTKDQNAYPMFCDNQLTVNTETENLCEVFAGFPSLLRIPEF